MALVFVGTIALGEVVVDAVPAVVGQGSEPHRGYIGDSVAAGGLELALVQESRHVGHWLTLSQ